MAPGFRYEADLLHHREELLERAVPQIDYLGASGVRKETIEQRHLAAGIGDIDGPHQLGKAAGQQRFAGVEVEADQRSAAVAQKLHQKTRQQRLAHPRARRCDDIEWGWLRHHSRAEL